MRTLVLVSVFATIGLGACSAEDVRPSTGSDSLTACGADKPASTEPKGDVSFAKDVLPIFQKSCTFGTCHGTQTGNNHGVFLGDRGGAGSADAVRAALVNQASAAKMPLVTPGDVEQSWLVHKLEGTMCGFEKECSGGNCGERMPKGGGELTAMELGAIKAWVARGAKAD